MPAKYTYATFTQARPTVQNNKEGRLQLLDVPYHRLLQQIDADEAERADQALQASLARQAHLDILERKGKGKDVGQKAMWVDKYRPTKFTDLLGEEVSYLRLICFSRTKYACH